MTPDRSTQLELIPGAAHLSGTGTLPVVDPLDRQRQSRVLGRRGDRLGALGLIPVLRRQANVDVLAGEVARPRRQLQAERLGPRSLRSRR